MHRIVLIIGCILTYALLVFPKFSSALGGGQQQKVEFVVNVDHIATVNSIGLQVSPELRRVGPLEVIFESSDFFVLAPPKERQSRRKGVKSFVDKYFSVERREGVYDGGRGSGLNR